MITFTVLFGLQLTVVTDPSFSFKTFAFAFALYWLSRRLHLAKTAARPLKIHINSCYI